MITLLIVGLIAMAGFFIARALRRKHIEYIQHERACTCPENEKSTRVCGLPTIRYFQMIDLTKPGGATRRGAPFDWHVFDKCGQGHVQQIKHGSKWFVWYKLWWRRLYDPEQFVLNESLFKDAALIEETVRGLHERIALFESECRLRNEKFTKGSVVVNAVLPRPGKGRLLSTRVHLTEASVAANHLRIPPVAGVRISEE
ncbi:MAG: hypothetical protein AAB365_02620 [Patescibacteria group bacterium]